jgi:hypothetical protein
VGRETTCCDYFDNSNNMIGGNGRLISSLISSSSLIMIADNHSMVFPMTKCIDASFSPSKSGNWLKTKPASRCPNRPAPWIRPLDIYEANGRLPLRSEFDGLYRGHGQSRGVTIWQTRPRLDG